MIICSKFFKHLHDFDSQIITYGISLLNFHLNKSIDFRPSFPPLLEIFQRMNAEVHIVKVKDTVTCLRNPRGFFLCFCHSASLLFAEIELSRPKFDHFRSIDDRVMEEILLGFNQTNLMLYRL